MKILHVQPAYVPAWHQGGPPKSVALLCRSLVRLGEEVSVFTTTLNGHSDLDVPLGRPVLVDGVEVCYFQVRRPRKYAFSWSMAKRLKDKIREYDIVHINSMFTWPAIVAAFLCRWYGSPYIVSPRGRLNGVAFGHSHFKKWFYSIAIGRRDLCNAAAIHFLSEEERREASRFRLKVPAFVIPNVVDPEDFANLPSPGSFKSQYPELAGKKVILFLGRINWIKGLKVLSSAFGMLGRKRRDVHLVIAGPDDEGYGDRVREWLRHEGVLDRVTFTGLLMEMPKLAAMRDSTVFVMPSYSESFGMAVAEAMACGLPVVVSKGVNIWRDIVERGAGLAVEQNPEQLSEAIEIVLDNEDLRKQMGEAGKRLVRERFAPGIVGEAMREVYSRVSNHRP